MANTLPIRFPVTLVAKTIQGLEPVLEEELHQLSAQNVAVLCRAVTFDGDLEMLYKANYRLRTALRVLVPLFDFQFADEDDLYQGVMQFAWEQMLTPSQTIAVDAVSSDSTLNHTHYIALRTKDAIADRCRLHYNGRRPSVDVENPDFKINVHIQGSRCEILLDSSGASLHKRGYRVANAEAPMSEVLAAGLIYLSRWDRQSAFIDPMCGSGTLLIEAAMIANNYAAGMYRRDFGFMHWPGFDPDLWAKTKEGALAEEVEFDHPIIGSDISAKMLAAAKANIKSARLHKDIQLSVSPMEALKMPDEKNGIVLINPPYGERIRLHDLEAQYKSIGNVLKRVFSGYKAGVISSDFKALSLVGLKPTIKYTVFNGPLECRFALFDLYDGSRKGQFNPGERDDKTYHGPYKSRDDRPQVQAKEGKYSKAESYQGRTQKSKPFAEHKAESERHPVAGKPFANKPKFSGKAPAEPAPNHTKPDEIELYTPENNPARKKSSQRPDSGDKWKTFNPDRDYLPAQQKVLRKRQSKNPSPPPASTSFEGDGLED